METFEVQIVQQRRASGARGGLQALRKRFTMTVSDRCLRISLGPPTVSGHTLISITKNHIKSARVRGRLLRVAVDSGGSLTVRLYDPDEALRAAEAMMETWDIDPLVEDSEAIAAETEEEIESGVEGLVKHYMNNPRFRQLVHDIHDHIDAILSDAMLAG
ncbi:hypothetical protein PRNP1_006936 [Phytophthora ramorum]